MNPDRRAFEFDIRANPEVRAQAIADAVLEPQCPVMRVRDRRVSARELAGNRARGIDMGGPVTGGHGAVERLFVRRVEFSQLEQHAAGDARPQTGTVSELEGAAEMHAAAALADVRGSQHGELTRQQIRQAARRCGKELVRVVGHAGAAAHPGIINFHIFQMATSGPQAPRGCGAVS